jgi:PilZ domain
MTVSPTTRRYPRMKAPKSAVVAWKTAEWQEVSQVKTIALGGLFIRTKNPPKAGSTIQMLIVTPRGYLRTRANVRDVIAGEGMGVAIVSMEPEDRGKLERWLRQLAELEESTKARA